MPLIVTDDLEAAADALRPFYALYFGGMGAKGANFHANVPIRMGYEKEVDEIQELYLSGKKDEAGAKIPTALIEELSLIGPREKIREDLAKWRESVVTTLLDLRRRRHAACRRRARARLSAGYALASSASSCWGVMMRTPRCSPTGSRCLRSPDTTI